MAGKPDCKALFFHVLHPEGWCCWLRSLALESHRQTAPRTVPCCHHVSHCPDVSPLWFCPPGQPWPLINCEVSLTLGTSGRMACTWDFLGITPGLSYPLVLLPAPPHSSLVGESWPTTPASSVTQAIAHTSEGLRTQGKPTHVLWEAEAPAQGLAGRWTLLSISGRFILCLGALLVSEPLKPPEQCLLLDLTVPAFLLAHWLCWPSINSTVCALRLSPPRL
jgi:hypothetical protein